MNLAGHPIYNGTQTKKETEDLYRAVGENNHNYFRFDLNRPAGPAGIADAYDVAASAMMWAFEGGPATTTNFLASIAEYMQVYIARTKLLGDPNASGLTGQIAKQRREGAMAWVQAVAGVTGLAGFGLERINPGQDEYESSIPKKIGLSAGCLAGSAMMFGTYIEKALVALTSRGKTEGNECKGIKLNANSDARAIIDWFTMAIYPWVKNVKAVKAAIDLCIPLAALRDGVQHWVNEGVSKVFSNNQNSQFSNSTKKLLRYLFFLPAKENANNYTMPSIFTGDWLLGAGKFRDKYLVPILRLLGCKNIPNINVEGENGHTALVVQVPGNVSSSVRTTSVSGGSPTIKFTAPKEQLAGIC
jgi:hypothetical protein